MKRLVHKTCSRCHTERPKSDFHRDRSRNDGRVSNCKGCYQKYKGPYLVHKKIYRTSFKGYQKVLFDCITGRLKYAKSYKKRKILFTENEFRIWINSNPDYLRVYSKWIKSGRNPNLSPSVDRIDNDGHYEFGNIQIIPVIENRIKSDSKINRKTE